MTSKRILVDRRSAVSLVGSANPDLRSHAWADGAETYSVLFEEFAIIGDVAHRGRFISGHPIKFWWEDLTLTA